MRLLKSGVNGEFTLLECFGKDIPRYAILSHTWEADSEEVSFNDLKSELNKSKTGYHKLKFCAGQAARDGLDFFWVDTCCIDKSSSAELSEAINSMFCWYRQAAKCYVYLSDVSGSQSSDGSVLTQSTCESVFQRSRWFTRGWTLQELLAPASVEFFSRDGKYLGDRSSLLQEIHEASGVPRQALQGAPLNQFSVEERMSWISKRETKREEDAAYSMLGIFDIHIPLIYGEGQRKAFVRLRKEIEPSYEPQAEGESHSITLRLAESSPISTVPFRRDDDFVNRKELDELRKICGDQAARVALVGLGGVGKSQIAIEYAYRIQDTSPNIQVFWIYGGTRSRFEEGYRRIAEVTKMDGWNDPKADILRLVRDWLCTVSNGPWVMIIDNADDSGVFFPHLHKSPAAGISDSYHTAEPLSDFLPHSPSGSLLITSRSQDLAFRLTGSLARIIDVKPMNNDDALTLLQKKLGSGADENGSRELSGLLDCLPLALSQAAAYIAQRSPRMNVARYIEKFGRSDRDRDRLLKKDVGDSRRDARASNSVIATWRLSFEHIRETRPSAARLLSLMSLFDRQGIAESLLLDQYGLDNDEELDFEEDIYTLRCYSLIETSTNGCEFGMHRLVQLSTKKWLELSRELEFWKVRYAALMDTSFPVEDFENWPVCHMLFPHAQAMLKSRPESNAALEAWSSVLYKATGYATDKGLYNAATQLASAVLSARESSLGAEHPDTLRILGKLGQIKSKQGRYAEATPILETVTKKLQKTLTEEHTDTLTSMADLAETYGRQDRWEEAQKLATQVMETRKRLLGEEHPHTLSSMNDLSVIYIAQERCKEANTMLSRVIEISDRVRGSGNLGTLYALGNLVLICIKERRWRQGEQLGQQVLERCNQVFGKDHPDALTIMSNLSHVYAQHGGWKEAELLARQVIEMSTRVLGHEHRCTLLSMCSLASVYQNLGDWEKAVELRLQVTNIRKRVLGDDHPETLISISNLAWTYSEQARWKEAEALGRQVLETSIRTLGHEHRRTLLSMSSLASIYLTMKKWKEAEELLLQTVEAMERVFGDEDPETLISMSNLAYIYNEQARWVEAKALRLQVIATMKRVHGHEHPDTLISMSNLALIHENEGKWKEAEALRLQILEIRKRVHGDEHPDTLMSISALASTYNDYQARWKEAEDMRLQVIETRERLLGEVHPDTLSSKAFLVATYIDQARWKEAEQLRLQVTETRKRVFGDEHPDTLGSKSSLALIYHGQARLAEAEELETSVLETRKRLLGEQHPDTLTSMAHLALTYQSLKKWKEAELLRLDVIDRKKRILGEEHPSTLTSLADLVSMYNDSERWHEAEELGTQLLKKRKVKLGPEHPHTLKSMHALAQTWKSLGREAEAIKLMQECTNLRRQSLRADHPDYVASLSALDAWQAHQGIDA